MQQPKLISPAQVSARAFWALLDQFAWPVALLICIPLLIQRLGVSDFGFFSLALAVCGMSSLLSMGVGPITLRNVAVAAEAGNRGESILVVRRALGVLLICGGTITALSAALSPMFSDAIFSTMGNADFALKALLAGLACAFIQEFDTVFSMAVKGYGKFRLAALFEWAGRLVWAVVTVIAAAWGGLLAAILAMVLTMAFKCILKGVMASIVFGTTRVLVPHINFASLRPVLSASRWLWVQNLSGLLLMSVDKLVIGAFFGSASLGIYAACAQLAQFAFIVPATAGQALLPWLAQHHTNQTEPRAGWRKTLFFIGAVSSLGGVGMAMLAEQILTLWLGSEFASSNASLLAALAFSSALLAFSVPYHFMQLAIGNARMIGLANALGAAAFAVLWILVAPLGLVVLALAKSVYAIPLLYTYRLPLRH
jgi:O-antigen/teichoic acid export membrane protein